MRPPLPFPPCSVIGDPGTFCFVSVGVGFVTDPDPVKFSDTNAILERKISITPMDADMTAGPFGIFKTSLQLKNLEP